MSHLAIFHKSQFFHKGQMYVDLNSFPSCFVSGLYTADHSLCYKFNFPLPPEM